MSGLVQHFDSGQGAEVTVEAYSRNRALKEVQASGGLQDAVLRGRVYAACTLEAGVAPNGTPGTTSDFTLYNPFSSGMMLSVWRVSMGYISGTIAVGPTALYANTNPAGTVTTASAALAANNCLLSGGYTAKAKAFTTATLPATPTLLASLFNLTPIAAATALCPYRLVHDLDGLVVIMPGCALSIESTCGAGSSPLVVYAMTWEEIPLG